MKATNLSQLLLAALLSLGLLACNGGSLDWPAEPEPSTEQPEPTAQPPKPPVGTGVDPTTGMPDDTWHTGVGTTLPVDATLTPPPAPNERVRRRMDVDQLKRAFYSVTGGIGWTRMSGNEEIDKFDEFAATLGKPDYLASTLEDLAPGALFQKFLGDAARDVCSRWLAREAEVEQAERTFFTKVGPQTTPEQDKDAIVANLVALKLRMHGQDLAPGDPAMNQLVWLFDSAHHIAKDPAEAWNTVCVGLFTHPDFYTF